MTHDFYVKMEETFRREYQFVAGGHKTQTPAATTYSYVVSRDSAQITLTVAALSFLHILS